MILQFSKLYYVTFYVSAVKRVLGVLAFVLFATAYGYAQSSGSSLTLDDYKKFVGFKLANPEEDTYVKFDGGYVLDRETKPFVFNYSDGIERRIYLYKMLKGANRDQVGTMALYSTPKSGKTIKVCIPGGKADKQVWDFYIDELKYNGEKEQGFLSTLAFVLSREYSKLGANPGAAGGVAKEDDHYDFCFPGGAVVALADGTSKAIEEVKAGDRLMSFDAATQEKRETTVSDVQAHYRGKGFQLTKVLLLPVEEIFASAGAWTPAAPVELEATANHPVITKDGKKELGEVKEGDTLYYFDKSMRSFREYKVAMKIVENRAVERVYNLETEAGNYIVNGTVVLDK